MKKGTALSTVLLLLFLAACSSITPSSNVVSSSQFTPSSIESVTSISSTNSSFSRLTFDPPTQPFSDPSNWQGEHPKGLVGGWHGSQGVGSVYMNRYLFFDDGRFFFTMTTASETSRLRYMDGTWTFTGATIELVIHRKIVLEGGVETHNPDSTTPSRKWIEGAEVVRVVFSPDTYEYVSLSFAISDEDTSDFPRIYGAIYLGKGSMYWLASVGYEDMLTYWDTYEYLGG